MKNLTKLERHTAYLIMLEEAEDPTSYSTLLYSPCLCGFCYMIGVLFRMGNGASETIIRDYFPELYKRKPSTAANLFWFTRNEAGWEERKKILLECINETA
jgi:hypothetical protein